jgi:hypothetical protein
MTPVIYRMLKGLWKERSLDTKRVFLYKGKLMKNFRTAVTAACRMAGMTK